MGTSRGRASNSLALRIAEDNAKGATPHFAHVTSGGKRHGKRMRRKPSTVRVSNIVTEQARAALQLDANAELLGIDYHGVPIGRLLVYNRIVPAEVN